MEVGGREEKMEGGGGEEKENEKKKKKNLMWNATSGCRDLCVSRGGASPPKLGGQIKKKVLEGSKLEKIIKFGAKF